MADIKQAAQWLLQGKWVKREQWPVLVVKAFDGDEGAAIVDADPVNPLANPLEPDDLLAEDWEIAD